MANVKSAAGLGGPSLGNSRRSGAMLARIAFVGLVVGLSACKEPLYTGLNERDANMMIMILDKHQVAATRQKDADGKYSLNVEASLTAKAVRALAAEGYPKKEYQSLGDIFNNEGLVKTPFEQRARFIHAINQELSHSLSDIDGIVKARVHVMIPETTRFGEERQEPSAAVFIMHDRNKELDVLTPKIKQLVAHSVAGVKYENVSVVLMPSGQTIAEPVLDPEITASNDGTGSAGTKTVSLEYDRATAAAFDDTTKAGMVNERTILGFIIFGLGVFLGGVVFYSRGRAK